MLKNMTDEQRTGMINTLVPLHVLVAFSQVAIAMATGSIFNWLVAMVAWVLIGVEYVWITPVPKEEQ